MGIKISLIATILGLAFGAVHCGKKEESTTASTCDLTTGVVGFDGTHDGSKADFVVTEQ